MQGKPQSTPREGVQYRRFSQTVDSAVLRNAKRGDERAQAVLYKTFAQAVYTLALGICQNPHCAEDVLQNAFINFFRNLSSYEERAPLGLWLRKIAVNESLMYLRKHKKHKAVVSSDEDGFFTDSSDHHHYPYANADFSLKQAHRSEVRALLQKLPDEMRTVLWLKEVEGYTHQEIAKMVDKTPSYSKSVVARALNFLRARADQMEVVV